MTWLEQAAEAAERLKGANWKGLVDPCVLSVQTQTPDGILLTWHGDRSDSALGSVLAYSPGGKVAHCIKGGDPFLAACLAIARLQNAGLTGRQPGQKERSRIAQFALPDQAAAAAQKEAEGLSRSSHTGTTWTFTRAYNGLVILRGADPYEIVAAIETEKPGRFGRVRIFTAVNRDTGKVFRGLQRGDGLPIDSDRRP